VNRHALLATTTLLAGALAAALAAAGPVNGQVAPAPAQQVAAAPVDPPNIVFVVTDDMARAEMPYMTRTLRLIGGTGTTFSHAMSSFPLCCPARATMLTGQYAHNHGVLGNASDGYPEGGYAGFDSDSNTIATWMDEAGYQTGFVGKYLNGYGNQEPARVPPGWDDWHGTLVGSYRYVRAYENGVQNNYGKTYRTTWTTRAAVDMIDTRVPYGGPLMLFTWYSAPHNGLPIEDDDPRPVYGRSVPTPVPARVDRNDFDHLRAPRDPNFGEEDVSDKPQAIQNLAPFDDIDPLTLDELYQQRIETLQSVDRGVASMVGALRRSGELDNTVFVFTSDNGYMIGDHRVRQGKTLPYESSIRVPLLIRGPGFPAGVTRDQLVGTQDFAPTFAEIGGATPQRVLDGTSLLPLARIPRASSGRDMVVEVGPKTVGGPMTLAGLRTKRYTYVEYATGERELYDLRHDPYQLENLIGSPELDPDVEASLQTQLAATRDCVGSACRVPTRY